MNLKTKKSQAVMEFLMTYGWAILAAIILMILAVCVIFSSEDLYTPIDEQCLAERLCWDNGYEFYTWNFNNAFGSNIFVKCYEINENGNKLLHEFVNINFTALNQKYVCDG